MARPITRGPLKRYSVKFPPALVDALDRLAKRKGTSRAALLDRIAREELKRERMRI